MYCKSFLLHCNNEVQLCGLLSLLVISVYTIHSQFNSTASVTVQINRHNLIWTQPHWFWPKNVCSLGVCSYRAYLFSSWAFLPLICSNLPHKNLVIGFLGGTTFPEMPENTRLSPLQREVWCCLLGEWKTTTGKRARCNIYAFKDVYMKAGSSLCLESWAYQTELRANCSHKCRFLKGGGSAPSHL